MNDIERLKQYAEIEENVALKTLTTLKIGGIAKYVCYPYNQLGLSLLLRYLKVNNIDYKFLGKGSNVLCGDNFFDGAIIKLDRHMNSFYVEENGEVIVEAGCSIISLAYEMAKMGLSGLEFASGIPATIGGTIFMNAGAYKHDMSEIVQSVLIFDNNDYRWLSKEELGFSYRKSVFQKRKDYIIVAAKIKLVKKNAEEIKTLIQERRDRRVSSQPLNLPSAGSVFRNNETKQAWQYIDELKLRGFKIGGATISTKHANFIVNEKNATAKDFIGLVNLVKDLVKENYQEELHTEVEYFNCQ